MSAVWELSQSFYFDAAHTLRRQVQSESEAAGSRRVHGHTYEAEITLAGQPADGSGMVVDLAIVRREIARVRELLDHHLLDEVEGLGPATLENLCSYLRMQLSPALPGLCTVSVARRSSGDRCVLRWSSTGT